MSGVGFSYGCAELALKKPPPFVPSFLMASCDATGPCGMTLRCAPSSVVTVVYGLKFWITPCEHSNSAATIESGSRMYTVARVISTQKLPIVRILLPRETAHQRDRDRHARRGGSEFWTASAAICTK